MIYCKKAPRKYKLLKWHRWFAWFPVTGANCPNGSKIKVWLQWIFRKGTLRYGDREPMKRNIWDFKYQINKPKDI